MSSKTHTIIKSLIPLLESAYPGYGREFLATKLNTTSRNVTRYLTDLKVLGYNVVSSETKPKLWRIEQSDIAISHRDVLSLQEISDNLNIQGNLKYKKALFQVINKLKSIIPDKIKRESVSSVLDRDCHVFYGSESDYTTHQQMILFIYSAIKEKQTLKITYRRFGENVFQTKKHNPLGLANRLGRLYLIASSPCYSERVYPLYVRRIKFIQRVGSSFELPTGFDMDKYYKNAFSQWHGTHLIHLKIRVKTDIMKLFLEEHPIHPSQKLLTSKKGEVILCLEVNWGEDFKGWLLSWGANLEVIEPENIRDIIKTEFSDASKIYIA